MTTELVVILPVHNEVQVIHDCITHLLNDTHITWCIVVCDRCTDNTHSIAEKAANGDKRVIILDKRTTVGSRPHIGHRIEEAMNFGLMYLLNVEQKQRALFGYVMKMDADTRLPSDYVTRALKCFSQDDKIGSVAIGEKQMVYGVGTIIKREALHDIGDRIPSCAREDTCLHWMIEACKYNIAHIKYGHSKFILPDPPYKQTRRRLLWGARGIGYSYYEMHVGIIGVMLRMTKSLLYYHDILNFVCTPVGYIEAWAKRAPRIELLRDFSKTTQKKQIANIKSKIRNKFRSV